MNQGMAVLRGRGMSSRKGAKVAIEQNRKNKKSKISVMMGPQYAHPTKSANTHKIEKKRTITRLFSTVERTTVKDESLPKEKRAIKNCIYHITVSENR